MGDNFLEGQANSTKKRRAKATAAMQAPKLITRPDEIIDEYTIDCRNGQVLTVGEILRCFPSSNGAPVDVARDHNNIGTIGQRGGGQSLRMQIEPCGVGTLRVRSFNELTSTAQVERVREEKQNGQ
jgi:hypothetical protein